MASFLTDRSKTRTQVSDPTPSSIKFRDTLHVLILYELPLSVQWKARAVSWRLPKSDLGLTTHTHRSMITHNRQTSDKHYRRHSKTVLSYSTVFPPFTLSNNAVHYRVCYDVRPSPWRGRRSLEDDRLDIGKTRLGK